MRVASTLSMLAISCTGTTTHAAYWVVKVSAQGQTVELAAFLDATAGPRRRSAPRSSRSASPPTMSRPGRLAARPSVSSSSTPADLPRDLHDRLRRGQLPWTSIWTPYAPGLGTANRRRRGLGRLVTPLPVRSRSRARMRERGSRRRLAGRISSPAASRPASSCRCTQARARRTLRRSGSTEAMAVRPVPSRRPADGQDDVLPGALCRPRGRRSRSFCARASSSGAEMRELHLGGFAVMSNIVRVPFKK